MKNNNKISFEELIEIQEKNASEIIKLLIDKTDDFSIICGNTFLIEFEPKLPQNLYDEIIHIFTSFYLSNYSLENITINEKLSLLEFNTSFGKENFETKVRIPLRTIYKINGNIEDFIDECLYLNAIVFENKFIKYFKDNKSDLNKSLNVFLSNPKNKEILKKK